MAPDPVPGFAHGTTGGSAGPIVHPRTLRELEDALCMSHDAHGVCTDSSPRVVLIDRVFDFRGSLVQDGTALLHETGCRVRACPDGAGQLALDRVDFCHGRESTPVEVDRAGVRALLTIGSNKTLRGIGADAGIVGTGLMLRSASNVIVQRLTISDINPQAVWGGDAITLDGVDHVWLDHLRVAQIGRQMLVTGFSAARHVTVSNSEFDGRTAYSSTCDGHHYWLWLFLGSDDSITLVGNDIHDTSGRGPHSGGMHEARVRVQIVNNYFHDISGEGAAMSRTALSDLLIEGNVFEHVTYPVLSDPRQPGPAFAPFAPAQAERCRTWLGRRCEINLADSAIRRDSVDEDALPPFEADSGELVLPLAAGDVARRVREHAGPARD
ncbi:right-handed parallel beta-helix repeat-containing protein [Paludibacterium yongneupense]|uniref:pectate lyase family protein n=1 Tax=Paludibacterium yongneupense TaxID=400061 RepID=UPI00146AF7ED|nr:right-handed parallel beta-helix repeat-containing protein [Paludibacterium yongneupense]